MRFRFGAYDLDTAKMDLSCDGRPVPVEPQVFAVLAHLVQNADRVVGKDELVDRIWDGRAISDGALASRINAARRAIGDSGRDQALIRTLPKRGFRFVAELASVPDDTQQNSERPSLAVLPFVNLANDPQEALLSDGMFEDVVMALSRIRWLPIISSASTSTFANQLPDIRRVAQDLDASYVLRGSFRRVGEQGRISMQLVNSRTGAAIWAQRYDLTVSDRDALFGLLDEIVMQAVHAVEHELGRAEQARARRMRPENLDAWLACQKGLARIRDEAALHGRAEVSECFDQAIALDPGFALAHACRAFSEYWKYVEGHEDYDIELAHAHIRRALEIDPQEPFAHQALGAIEWLSGRFDAASESFETALDLNPSNAWAHTLLGVTRLGQNRPDDAIAQLCSAIRLSPRDTLIGLFYAVTSLAHFAKEDYLACLDWGYKALPYPQPRWVQAYVLSALGHLGRDSEAGDILTLIARVRPEFSLRYIERAFHVLDGEPKARLIDGLRRAGLRET